MSEPTTVSYLAYPLRDGFVGNWLVAGPHVSSIPVAWDDAPGIAGTPVERGPLDTGTYRVRDQSGEHPGVWAYRLCPEDHAIDHSGRYPAGSYLRSWAYAEIVSEAAQTVRVTLAVTGPAGLWLDDSLVLRVPGDNDGPTTARIGLQAGPNRLLLRFEAMSAGETAHAATVRLQTEAARADGVAEVAGLHVQIPTVIESVGRRAAFEELTAATFLERDVFEGDAPIVLRWPEGERGFCPAHVRLHGPGDAIFALADVAGEPGDRLPLGQAISLPPGPMRVTLMPNPDEVYLHHVRVTHHLPFRSLGRQRYTATPGESDLEMRRREALAAVAEHADSVYGQIARVALGMWGDVDDGVMLRASEQSDESVLLALVGMLHRFGATVRAEDDEAEDDEPRDSKLVDKVIEAAEAAILAYDRWDAPGTEPARILRHTVELLAGQRYPERTFADGRSGAWHRERGEGLAVAWLSDFAAYGSARPGDGYALEQEIAVLAALTDLADASAVYDLAAVCLDKLLYLLAVNSQRGVFGAASPSAPASIVTSGYLQPTAPISRLLWGTGIYNHHLGGVLGLALATNYEPPEILESIAHDAPDGVWSRERHAPPGAAPVSVVTYKTPEYVLSSLADVRPGDAGRAEQVWRATLGPAALVFVNQPGSSSESDARLPGLWAGNARLPRVGQWRDAILAMHRVAEADVLAWTHAHFPCAAFDEYAVYERWAFARVGDGYLAIGCSTGLTLTREGRYAERELRGFGAEPIWLVQMGSAARDGDFATFQAKMVTASPEIADGAQGVVRWTTIRGDTLNLTWDGPFLVNDDDQSPANWPHLDSPYAVAALPCTGIDIRHGDGLLRLDFMTS